MNHDVIKFDVLDAVVPQVDKVTAFGDLTHRGLCESEVLEIKVPDRTDQRLPSIRPRAALFAYVRSGASLCSAVLAEDPQDVLESRVYDFLLAQQELRSAEIDRDIAQQIEDYGKRRPRGH